MLVVTFLGSGGRFFMGWAKPVPIAPWHFKDQQRGMMLVGLAGPLTNFILVFIAAGLVWATYSWSLFLAQMFYMLFVLNVILGTLNLIPIPPLDGSRVLGGFLPRDQWARWMQLDRWGNFVFIGLFVVLVAFPAVFDATFGAVLNLFYATPAGRVSVLAASTLEWRESGGVRWLQWEGAGVVAAFPTREGGVSPAPFDSLNLGLSTSDAAGNVLENRRRLCAAVGLPPDRMVVPGQVHGTTMAWVDDGMAGRGAFASADVISEHDALLTASPGLGLAISYADCVPVVIVGEGCGGAVPRHGARRLARHDRRHHRARGRDAFAARPPDLCRRRSEHRAMLLHGRRRVARSASRRASPVPPARRPSTSGRAREAELLAAGVPASGIAVTRVCTSSDARFFSHRRDHGATGRHLALAWRQEA